MCVIFFYVNSNPAPGDYKLILASNRDEFFARDTRMVAQWANAEHVYGGIDLEPGREGGTWLAIGGHDGIFKVGALLNLTGEPKPRNAVGRGMLVSDFVASTGGSNIASYNEQLLADCSKYSAFNFIAIEIGDRRAPARISLCSNVPPTLVDYAEGKCYGFGNSLPAAPFEKVRYGQRRFRQIVENFVCVNKAQLQQADGRQQTAQVHACKQAELIENLQHLLKCKHKHWPDAELQRRAPNWGEQLSALNVNVYHENYGSRTHSIILIDEHDNMHFVEETMAGVDPEGEWVRTHIEKQYFKTTD